MVAIRSDADPSPHRGRAWLARLPWELLLAWLTLVSYRRLGDWGIPVGRGAEVSRVDVWGLLFPVLFLVTAVALLSRVDGPRPASAQGGEPIVADAPLPRRPPGGAVPGGGARAGGGVGQYAAGVLAYAATMNQSLDATLQTKARTFVGSDLAPPAGRRRGPSPELVDRSTDVQSYGKAWVERGRGAPGRDRGHDRPRLLRAGGVLGQPGSFADTSLADVLEQLRGAGLERRGGAGRGRWWASRT